MGDFDAGRMVDFFDNTTEDITFGASVNPADNYDDVITLFELDFHYQINSLGSDAEYTKRVIS